VAAALPIAVGGAQVAADPNLILGPKDETNRATFSYATPKVFGTLTQTVERNGRIIVESIPDSYTLVVSYPFSFLANNWGGNITIICIKEGFGTTVTIIGSGRDAKSRVKKIGDEILTDMTATLRQLP
jgi:hypothetical protein